MQQSSLAGHRGSGAASARAVRRWFGSALAGAALMLSASHAFASGTDELKAFIAQVHAARGDFTQQIVNAPPKSASDAQPTLAASNHSSGNFVFARPGKFIWLYQKPYQQLLQADGDKLYVYDKDLNQVTERKLGGALGASPAAILFGSNDLEKNFILKEGQAKDGMEWLEATPKAKDTTFDHIGIGLKDGVPQAMELRDSFGQVSLLTFKNFVKNPPLSTGQFQFVVPKGADVLNQ